MRPVSQVCCLLSSVSPQARPRRRLRVPRCLPPVPGRSVPPATRARSAASRQHPALQVQSGSLDPRSTQCQWAAGKETPTVLEKCWGDLIETLTPGYHCTPQGFLGGPCPRFEHSTVMPFHLGKERSSLGHPTALLLWLRKACVSESQCHCLSGGGCPLHVPVSLSESGSLVGIPLATLAQVHRAIWWWPGLGVTACAGLWLVSIFRQASLLVRAQENRPLRHPVQLRRCM